jgi:uncharacterized protein YdeI (YjbR/CyaY-like superfamily)
LKVQLEADESPRVLSAAFIQCLKDEPAAYAFFQTLPKSHQNYFSKWIDGAKTPTTKAKRITQAVIALAARQKFNEMLRTAREPE